MSEIWQVNARPPIWTPWVKTIPRQPLRAVRLNQWLDIVADSNVYIPQLSVPLLAWETNFNCKSRNRLL